MEIIRGLENLKSRYKNPVVTLGNFDGLHMGHQRVFNRVKEFAGVYDGTSVVITFVPHPIKVIAPERELKLLTPFNVKAELIRRMGIDVLVGIDFNKEFASIEPDDFIKRILVTSLNSVHVTVGHNYRFGKAKRGNTDMLRRRGKRYGFKFNVVRNVKKGGDVVSSSRIRKLLLHGNVSEANSLLGWSYFIEGNVISGAGRGKRILDTPTANLSTPNELVPKDGVYVVKVQLEGNVYEGVANIGTDPTFGENELSYEVHLFNFDGDIKGKELRIHFIERLRDEIVFVNHVELKKQIDKDVEAAKRFLVTKQFPLMIA